MSLLDNFVKDAIEAALLAGQKVVSDEQYNERLAICRGCEHFGKVKPLPFVTFDEGCQLCHCPKETKLRLTNKHSILNKSPLCDLGKWEQTDKKYDNSK